MTLKLLFVYSWNNGFNFKKHFMKNNENSHETNHSNSNTNVIRDALADSGKNIKQFSSQLTEELGQYLEGKKGDIAGMKCKCKNTIQENPFVAVIGSLAVGALIAMICKK